MYARMFVENFHEFDRKIVFRAGKCYIYGSDSTFTNIHIMYKI